MKQVLSGSLTGSFVNIDKSLLSRSSPMQVLVSSKLQNSDFSNSIMLHSPSRP